MTDRDRKRIRFRLAGLVLAELALVLGLHLLARQEAFAIDWSDLSGWLDATAFEDAFGTAVLFVALVLAYWLLLSTVSYTAASLSGRPAAAGALQWLTLPPIRRLVRRAVALSIAVTAVTGPLWPALGNRGGDGASPRPIVTTSSPGAMLPERRAFEPSHGEGGGLVLPSHLRPAPEKESPVVMVPRHLQEAPPGEAGVPIGSANATAAPGPDAAQTHTVRVARGDHLWGLSEQHLRRMLGRSALGDHEIAPYWVRVMEANRATIRSGDPDLIYPGEVIRLPPIHQ